MKKTVKKYNVTVTVEPFPLHLSIEAGNKTEVGKKVGEIYLLDALKGIKLKDVCTPYVEDMHEEGAIPAINVQCECGHRFFVHRPAWGGCQGPDCKCRKFKPVKKTEGEVWTHDWDETKEKFVEKRD